MESKVLFLSAPLVNTIWGGNYFKDTLKLTDSNEKIGEMWCVSALNQAMSYVTDGIFKGKSLKEVYDNNKELFNSKLDVFPILVKIIATTDKLSVQVHPDDTYAAKYENSLGKTEGWLILDASKDASIVIGHNANSYEELSSMVANDEYDKLLKYQHVTPGEFYPIEAGTIHAIGKDIVLLEVQQSSNVTYRFYDYHRKDKNGNERELHVKKALEVTSLKPYSNKIVNCFNENIQTIWENNYFKVDLYDVNNELILNATNRYLIVTVALGEVNVLDKTLKQGDSFIILANESVNIKGNGKIVTTLSLM